MIAAETTSQDTPQAPACMLQEGESLPLGTSLYLLRDGQDFVYFLFTQPIASHAVDDKVGRNLCLARCALFGLATHAALAQAFALNPRAVARAKARLIERGEGDFVPLRKPRRRHGALLRTARDGPRSSQHAGAILPTHSTGGQAGSP